MKQLFKKLTFADFFALVVFPFLFTAALVCLFFIIRSMAILNALAK